ncbi:hypothetical protein ACWET9_38305 [Streptomyces sp. NPDC004059]
MTETFDRIAPAAGLSGFHGCLLVRTGPYGREVALPPALSVPWQCSRSVDTVARERQ